jgi:hypothetical protein
MRHFLILLIAMSILSACGRDEPTPTPMPTETPIPAPTLAPEPVTYPSPAFMEWLATNDFEFRQDVPDGSKRFTRATDPNGVAVDIYPDGIAAWGMTMDPNAATVVLSETTDIVIQALEMHGHDPKPVQDALQAPYQLPMSLQEDGYNFLLERTASGVNTRATFLEP